MLRHPKKIGIFARMKYQCLLTSAYLPPIQYMARLYAAERVYEERCDNYVKQTYRNRAIIASANGPLSLSIPILRTDQPKRPMRDLCVSPHGKWQQEHWRALVSAYEHSPYFPYYADYLRPFYEQPPKFLVDFNAALLDLICQLLSLSPSRVLTEQYEESPAPGVEDTRELILPKRALTDDPAFRPQSYHQVFEQKHGFLPNMSILDLLFNKGPESRLVLRDSFVVPALL